MNASHIQTGKGFLGRERRYDPNDVIGYLESLRPARGQTVRELADSCRS